MFLCYSYWPIGGCMTRTNVMVAMSEDRHGHGNGAPPRYFVWILYNEKTNKQTYWAGRWGQQEEKKHYRRRMCGKLRRYLRTQILCYAINELCDLTVSISLFVLWGSWDRWSLKSNYSLSLLSSLEIVVCVPKWLCLHFFIIMTGSFFIRLWLTETIPSLMGRS